ncbi:phosphoribosyltransferase-like protein [Thauera propionica]|jgi:hypothetical protein|uniref:phosphoribosyltransferase-like protein n=1 Tax=Thauera propionica TaxID=2019431 RepID=UPI0023F20F34|nr:hypothetical protein [Thauera propionica]MDD3673892.1 hypothetical protein [Thauera propionica]MDX9716881.1 hypothetical protein [Thauera sp.]
MKQDLAFNLIGELLGWDDAEFAQEFQALQLMIDLKYDSYQGFQPATRFHVALLNWLSQFATLQERQTAYRFVKERLIFVTQREMHHLVSLTMPMLETRGRQRVAHELGIPMFRTHFEPAARQRLELLQRRTLFVGLSDGARMDVFRRYNENRVSNEQVVPYPEINEHKWQDLKEELVKSLKRSDREHEDPRFEVLCLVDDFTGSGSSLIRLKDGEWKGKIPKLVKALNQLPGGRQQFASDPCFLHVHHYLASAKAEQQIRSDLNAFGKANPQLSYSCSFSYVLPASVVIEDGDIDQGLVALIRAHYNSTIEDEHTGKDIWYGYKQCGLPLVLEHNTPNNSIALLWGIPAENTTPTMRPLFARRKRHSSHG